MVDIVEKTGERTGPGEMAFAMDEKESREEKNALRLEQLGGTLQGQFDTRVGERIPIERRMISDLRQYRGIYEPDVQEKLSSKKHASTR